jgi:hypothetical protein
MGPPWSLSDDSWNKNNISAYATFNNISVIWWRSVLLVEEIEVPGENY